MPFESKPVDEADAVSAPSLLGCPPAASPSLGGEGVGLFGRAAEAGGPCIPIIFGGGGGGTEGTGGNLLCGGPAFGSSPPLHGP